MMVPSGEEVSMRQGDLVREIKAHANRPGKGRSVNAMVALAEAIVAVRFDDGEHELYFDRARGRLPEDSLLRDAGPRRVSWPTDIGVLEFGRVTDFKQAMLLAKLILVGRGEKISWHHKPRRVN